MKKEEVFHLHIALCSDENYIIHAATLISSVLSSCKEFDKITFHLLSNQISENSICKIRFLLDKVPSRYLQVYDLSDLGSRLVFDMSYGISVSSYLRLFLGSVIDATVNRIIYLDVDGIVVSSLNKLWSLDLKDNFVAGVYDINTNKSKLKIELSLSDVYINAGMLLISLENWRKYNLEKRFMDFFFSKKGVVYHADQGIINWVCKGRIEILPPKYNVVTSYFDYSYKSQFKITSPFYRKKEVTEALEYPVFIHFTESYSNRPWVKGCKHPFRSEYIHYRNQTDWKYMPLSEDKRTFNQKLLSRLFFLLPFPFFTFLTGIKAKLKKL